MREQKLYNVSVETPERRRLLARLSYGWKNFKMDVTEIG
jgi:hypothetical protein